MQPLSTMVGYVQKRNFLATRLIVHASIGKTWPMKSVQRLIGIPRFREEYICRPLVRHDRPTTLTFEKHMSTNTGIPGVPTKQV